MSSSKNLKKTVPPSQCSSQTCNLQKSAALREVPKVDDSTKYSKIHTEEMDWWLKEEKLLYLLPSFNSVFKYLRASRIWIQSADPYQGVCSCYKHKCIWQRPQRPAVLENILVVYYSGKMASYHLEKRTTVVNCIPTWMSLGNMAVSVWKVTALIMKIDTTSNEAGESDTVWERYMECGMVCVLCASN
jgi:hypothetical protein